ncbi:helix-turn-helix transcriptional regulator [Epibacterium sp. SM1979]|uniref:Helix-turn-helix transcriptional regulator n=1 Tax=Tritonibacter litoralis TaxID=2662264 RepID=A0A843YKS5_9RHOB|nr:helix-turn-helix transcriptional regulator [Tritonibacter litoralis]MQQ10014.1 helix-turn-helix transcriptional regulator [Tritonibacter litoralis]
MQSDPARPAILVPLIVVQSLCAIVFLGDIIGDVLVPDVGEDEGRHVIFEILATFGLIAAIFFEIRILRRLTQQRARLETALSDAQSAVFDVIEAQFDLWALSPAERDVATFLVKGLSTAEIAEMRGSKEGTVKAQLNAIYRKSGCANRSEVMSQLIDTLMGRRDVTA